MTRRTVAVLVAALAAVAPAGAVASGDLTVDAGASQRVEVGARFLLEGAVDQSGASVSWDGPAGCTIDDAAALSTPVACAAPGVAPFVLTATDGTVSGSDEVRIAVVRSETQRVLDVDRSLTAGVPDEAVGRTGEADGETSIHAFTVPTQTSRLSATLDWDGLGVDLDLRLRRPDGSRLLSAQGATLTAKPERIEVDRPEPGEWTAEVEVYASGPATWRLDIDAAIVEGDASLPSILVPRVEPTSGEPVTLVAEVDGGLRPYDVRWERDDSVAFDDGAGLEHTFTFTGSVLVKAKVRDAAGFEAIAFAFVRDPDDPIDNEPRPFTVVGVIDNLFTPYHYDFVGSQHPWNTDNVASNDFDFRADPATYIPGYPGATPLDVTIPRSRGEIVANRATEDSSAWLQFRSSNAAFTHLYWFPGTKIVGAARFGTDWLGTNSSHGTRSAASAAGNIHGTCPECLVVLLAGSNADALRWAAEQPWIDVVTNSYGHSTIGGAVRDNIYLDAPVTATKEASEDGQVVVFSAGNGLANAYDVPMFTYWSSEKGPDWMVTVGAAAPGGEQTYLGAGKPVDITSIGSSYPSTGGNHATGTGTHSGTSNAAPVTAGTFAKVLQASRAALGDLSPGHADGVVASGAPVACGAAVPDCALGDGVLTRAELQDLVFHNVLPAPRVVQVQTVPTTEYGYYYQGHGTLTGRSGTQAQYDEEWSRMIAVARGSLAPLDRPAGEANWFVVDSLCRQRLWGTWSGGYYRGSVPALDAQTEPLAYTFNAWCDGLPQRTLARFGDD